MTIKTAVIPDHLNLGCHGCGDRADWLEWAEDEAGNLIEVINSECFACSQEEMNAD